MEEVLNDDKWLRYVKQKNLPKTEVWDVISQVSDCALGEIKWYPQWRHYCFFPSIGIETVHSDRCLLSISKFITKLNEEHKVKLAEKYVSENKK